MKILKCIFITLIWLVSEQVTFSQYYLKSKSDSISLESDSVIIFVEKYLGAINWQASSDLINWVSLDNHKDTLGVRIDSSAYYRASIVEENCNPVMSDTAFLIEKLTKTSSDQFTVDTQGGVFLLPSGIKVKIPVGAVSEPKEINVDIIGFNDANTLAPLSNYEKASFLSGISIATDQFDFIKPIKIKIPLQNIDVTSLPILYELNSESRTWLFSDEKMIVIPKDKFIEIILKGTGQKAIANGTKSESITKVTKSILPFKGDIRSYILGIVGYVKYNADPCRGKGVTIKYDSFDTTFCDNCNKTNGCYRINVDMEVNYWGCNPPQKDADIAYLLGSDCKPKLTISPDGGFLPESDIYSQKLKIKKGESLNISLSTEIAGFPLSDQVIIPSTIYAGLLDNGNISFNSVYLTTNSYGNASLIPTGTEIGPVIVDLSVSFKYYETTLYVSGPGGTEEEPYDRVTKDLDTTFLVTVYDKPEVETSIGNLEGTTVTVGGNVVSDNYDEVRDRGVYWGKNPDPELTGTRVESGSGTGSFSINLSDLDCNTTYYVKAYATNSAGIAYGIQISFTTSATKVKIIGPKEITMNTIDNITFTAELTNSLDQPIDGKVYWNAVPANNSVRLGGAFKDPLIPTFYGLREGEALIVASAVPVGTSNPLDCAINDTVRVKVVPDCDSKPIQQDCHSIWEGTVQFSFVDYFKSCDQPECDCNENCLQIFYFDYDFKVTLEFEVLSGDFALSYGLGTMHVTGTEESTEKLCEFAVQCDRFDGGSSIDQTVGLGLPKDILPVFYFDQFTPFLSSYNDFQGSFGGNGQFVYASGFGFRGSISGNSGSLTITYYTNNKANTAITGSAEILLTKISK